MGIAATSTPTMTCAATEEQSARQASPLPAAVQLAVVARLAAGGHAAHSDLYRDLAPFLSHKLTAAAIRDVLGRIVAELVAGDLAVDDRGRVTLLDAGIELAGRQLAPCPLPKDWIAIRDCRLVPVALGLSGLTVARAKAIGTPEGLRAAILRTMHGLPEATQGKAAMLRGALAAVALGRAFGKDVRDQLHRRDGLPPRTARILAAQLSRRPRDPGSDTKLFAMLAAEAVGSFQSDVDALRTAVLRRWLGASLEAVAPRAAASALDAEPIAAVSRPAAANRPGLDGFVAAVAAAARLKADGWPGNRKASVARVFDAVAAAHPSWGLSEGEFKSMLAEAHRLGRVVLATADLKSKSDLVELERSAVAYRNAILHFVRVED